MRNSKFNSALAVLLSAAMVVATPVTAFAADPANDASTGTMEKVGEEMAVPDANGQTINIYSTKITKVMVPTTLTVALNPEEMDVKTASGASAVNNTVISLNYGIANLSKKAKNVYVSIEATDKNVGVETSKPLVFTDTIEKAQKKDDSNTEGAEFGEYKVYLEVAPAADVVTAQADDTALDKTVDGTKLSSVKMAAATAGTQVLKGGSSAKLAYNLLESTYTQIDIVIGTETTNDQSDKFELNALGAKSVSGFTIQGDLNTYADWSNVTEGIKLVPTYKVEDIDGSEEAKLITGTGRVLPTAPAEPVAAAGASGSVVITAPTGKTFDSSVFTAHYQANTAFNTLTWSSRPTLSSDGTVWTISSTTLGYLTADDGKYNFGLKYDGGDAVTVTYTPAP